MKAELLAPAQLSQELRTADGADMALRRWGIGLSFAGAFIGAVVGAYQTGILNRLPDILPGEVFDAEKVDASDYAYRHGQMPDAMQMLVNYGLTAAAIAAGGKDRAEQFPALPVIAAGKAAFDTALCLGLARTEWRENQKLCSWCQVATLVSALTLAVTLPEAWKALKGGSDRPATA